MNHKKTSSAPLKRTRKGQRSTTMARPLKVAACESDPPSPKAKTADNLVIACRENVRFLNFHLLPFEKYLELPALVDNTLYLAYTIKIKDNAPFDAITLRRWLTREGIETRPSFSFVGDSEDTFIGTASRSIRKSAPRSEIDSRAFCLGCHQYLTILDLEHIIDSFESFFAHLEGASFTCGEH